MPDFEIKIYNQHSEYIIDEKIISNIVRFVQREEQTQIKKLTIIISTDQHLNKLKQEFYDQDLLTDTISFNLNEPGEPIEGEIYISADRIADNADNYDIRIEREFANVLIHS
ncbi:MAG TPA: rRNA maturation RNase YbeY, partial [bacterium]|nr:rRNA maturation RNase YbeY [bacterium]